MRFAKAEGPVGKEGGRECETCSEGVSAGKASVITEVCVAYLQW